MTTISAMILAGGRSTRMGGGNKGLRLLGAETLLSRVIGRMQPQCGPLAINANGGDDALAAYGLPVVADSYPGFAGPLAGVLTAMDWAKGTGAQSVVCVSVDTPFLPSDLIVRLHQARRASGIAIAASPDASGQMRDHPTCGIWPLSLRDELCAALDAGERRIGRFAASRDPGRAIFDSQPFDPFLNMNTPEDLTRALALI